MAFITGNNCFSFCNQAAKFPDIHVFFFRDLFHFFGINLFARRIHLCCIVHIVSSFPADSKNKDRIHHGDISCLLHNRYSFRYLIFLRRHYPYQVHGSKCNRISSQPINISSPVLYAVVCLSGSVFQEPFRSYSQYSRFCRRCKAFLAALLLLRRYHIILQLRFSFVPCPETPSYRCLSFLSALL